MLHSHLCPPAVTERMQLWAHVAEKDFYKRPESKENLAFIEAREACWKVWSFKQTQLLFIKARAGWRGPGIWLACFLLLVELFHSFSIETIGWWDYVWHLAWAKNVRSGNLWLDWCLCDPDLMRMVNQYMNKTLCITCLLPSRLFAALTVSLNCRA